MQRQWVENILETSIKEILPLIKDVNMNANTQKAGQHQHSHFSECIASSRIDLLFEKRDLGKETEGKKTHKTPGQ